MVQWVNGLIPHGGPIELFSFEPVLHNWSNKGCGMFYSVWDYAYKRTLTANWKE